MNANVSTSKAADLIGVSKRTMEAWRLRGEGPPFVRISKRCVRYRIEDLEGWTAERVKSSTSEE